MIIFIYYIYIMYPTEEERMKALRASRNKSQKDHGLVIYVLKITQWEEKQCISRH